MGARLQIKPHLSAEAVEVRYRAAKSALERTHWQVIRLFLAGQHSEEIARIVGYSIGWVRVLTERYNAHGPEALLDGRRRNPGAARLLDEAGLEALRQALQSPPQEGGAWTGGKVARWMERRLGRTLNDRRGTEALHRVGWTPQKPRPRHQEADAVEQARFQGGNAPAGLSVSAPGSP